MQVASNTTVPPLTPAEVFIPRDHSIGSISDEDLDYLAALLDDIFQIPGTRIRIGLDAFVGLIPGIGDMLTGTVAFVMVVAAWRRRLPRITLARMIANVLIDTTLGAVPLIGDLFDVYWKCNRKNFRLLMREKHCATWGTHTWRDWLFLLTLLGVAAAVISLPIALLWWVIHLRVS